MNLALASKRGIILGIALVGFVVFNLPKSAVAAVELSGHFFAVLNEQGGFSDNRKTVTFYDSESFDAGPLFGVMIPYERNGNLEDPSAITVDPETGDVYVLSFDSGSTPGPSGTDPDGNGFADALGDYDLHKINFQTVLDFWQANHAGNDVRTLANPNPGTGQIGPWGQVPVELENDDGTDNRDDYVNYGVTSPGGVASFDFSHSNTYRLAGAIEKIGEINRNNPQYVGTERTTTVNEVELIVQHSALFTFLSQSQLLYIDDALNDPVNTGDTAMFDHDYRVVKSVVSASSVCDDAPNATQCDGGYDDYTTEAWEAHRVGKVLLDPTDEFGDPIEDISEPQTVAGYVDPLTEVRGVWVGDRDGGGDDIAFFEVDASGAAVGYKTFQHNGLTTFALDEDPFTNPNSNDGKIEKLFVDQDTGDLIMVEGSFSDDTPGESGVFRREVITYDNGIGQLQLGGWSEKKVLGEAGTFTKDTNDYNFEDDEPFFERGYWTAWDSKSDLMFFISPGEEDLTDPLVSFGVDIYVLNMNEDCDGTPSGTCDAALETLYGVFGTTTSYMNLDESHSLFFGAIGATGFANGNYGDKTVAFTYGIEEPEPILIGDYNEDGKVSAGDFTVWADNVGAPTLPNRDPANLGAVGNDDFESWKDHYGEGTFGSGAGGVAGSASVPEPASLALGVFGVLVIAFAVRRRSRSGG